MKLKLPNSLRARLVLTIVAAQWALLSLMAVAALPLYLAQAPAWEVYTREALDELGSSIVPDPTGVQVRPTATMARWIERHDGFWWAVRDGERVIAGGALAGREDLARAMTRLSAVRQISFELESGQLVGGEVRAMPLTDRDVVLAAGGLPATTGVVGWGRLLTDALIGHLLLLPMLALAAALVVSLFMRRAQRALARVTGEIEALAPARLQPRLDQHTVPPELDGLARAVNKAATRLQEGFERQRRFSAAAAHELKTPLAVLSARLDHLEPGPMRDALTRDVARLDALISDLITLARIRRGLSPERRSVDLARIVREAAADCAEQAIARDVELEVEAVPSPLEGDPLALALMTRNLIANAVAHSPKGAIVTTRLNAGGLAVIDRGDGVAAEDAPFLFDPFWRSGEANRPGSGLGLAIAAEVATAHDATIAVEATPGGGATFLVRF